MATTQETTLELDLKPLEERYEIIGELAGRDDARMFIAKRRESRADVLIAVMRTPPGDEGNALSHLAADANRLSELRHRNVVPITEGVWLGTDAFAVVTERVYYPSLAELLLRRDEAFSCPRVATVLQDINGALEWARGQKIVHRAIRLETVFLEPGSDRVLVTFTQRPLPLADMPGAEEDAKTIATLARAMLTRSVADPERDQLPLAEVRPGLPNRLVKQTEDLLQLTRASAVPDVSEYIAVVAMSDTLKRSEMECAETTRKLLEEERIAREMLEADRQAAERAAAEQARLFQHERDQFADEKEKIQRALEKEREVVARERAALAKEREEHGRDRAALMAEREEHKRWAAEVEKTFNAQAALLKQLAEEKTAEREAVAAEARPDVSLNIPPRPKPKRVKPEWARSLSRIRDRMPAWYWNPRWNVPVAVAAVLLLIGVSAIAVVRNRDSRPGDMAQGDRPAGVVVDSVAGGVATPPSEAPASVSGIPADFIASVAGKRTAPATPAAQTVASARAAGVPADFIAGVVSRGSSAPAPRRAPPVSTAPRLQTPPRPTVDTVFRSPQQASSLIAPVPNTVRPDSVVRTRPDSVVMPDTIPVDPRASRDRAMRTQTL